MAEEAVPTRSRGGTASDHADMSSDKPGEKPGRRKPEVSSSKDIPLRVSRPLSRGRKAQVMGIRLIFLNRHGHDAARGDGEG